MIKSLMLASYTYFDGTAIGDMFVQWEQAGFFTYLLPFLLIFALIFGILTKTKLFENKAVNSVIALAVGLLALQFPMVSQFFSEIFPRLGIALSVILVVMILLGLFMKEDDDKIKWVLFGVAAIILIIVLINTAGALGWSSSWWWQDNWPMVIGMVAMLGLIIAIIAGSSVSSSK